MLRAQWIKAARAAGWRESKPDGPVMLLRCAVQGCPGALSLPLDNLGPPPDPCKLEHVGQYAGPAFATYADLIRHLIAKRKSIGISQEDVAAAAGLADGHISKLESFDRIAQFPTLQLWAHTIGLEITTRPIALPPATVRTIERRPAPYRDTEYIRRLFNAR
jgi:hypothetical protein